MSTTYTITNIDQTGNTVSYNYCFELEFAEIATDEYGNQTATNAKTVEDIIDWNNWLEPNKLILEIENKIENQINSYKNQQKQNKQEEMKDSFLALIGMSRIIESKVEVSFYDGQHNQKIEVTE